MKPTKSICAGLLAASALALSANSRAQATRSHYAGVGAGQSTYADGCARASATDFWRFGFDRCEATNGTVKVFFGGRRNNFGAEFAVADIGKISASFAGQSFEWTATTLDFMLVGYIPITPRFSALGKLGFTNWYMEASRSVPGAGSSGDNWLGFSGTYALGLQFDLSDTLGLRGDWQHYWKIGDPYTMGQFSVDVVSAGVMFNY